MKLFNKLVYRVGNFYADRVHGIRKVTVNSMFVIWIVCLEYFQFSFGKSCMSCIWVTILIFLSRMAEEVLIFLSRMAVEVYRELIVCTRHIAAYEHAALYVCIS